MKKINYLLGALLALFVLSGCDDDDSKYVIESDPNLFAVYPIAIPVVADGGTYELRITGKKDWTMNLSQSK